MKDVSEAQELAKRQNLSVVCAEKIISDYLQGGNFTKTLEQLQSENKPASKAQLYWSVVRYNQLLKYGTGAVELSQKPLSFFEQTLHQELVSFCKKFSGELQKLSDSQKKLVAELKRYINQTEGELPTLQNFLMTSFATDANITFEKALDLCFKAIRADFCGDYHNISRFLSHTVGGMRFISDPKEKTPKTFKKQNWAMAKIPLFVAANHLTAKQKNLVVCDFVVSENNLKFYLHVKGEPNPLALFYIQALQQVYEEELQELFKKCAELKVKHLIYEEALTLSYQRGIEFLKRPAVKQNVTTVVSFNGKFYLQSSLEDKVKNIYENWQDLYSSLVSEGQKQCDVICVLSQPEMQDLWLKLNEASLTKEITTQVASVYSGELTRTAQRVSKEKAEGFGETLSQLFNLFLTNPLKAFLTLDPLSLVPVAYHAYLGEETAGWAHKALVCLAQTSSFWTTTEELKLKTLNPELGSLEKCDDNTVLKGRLEAIFDNDYLINVGWLNDVKVDKPSFALKIGKPVSVQIKKQGEKVTYLALKDYSESVPLTQPAIAKRAPQQRSFDKRPAQGQRKGAGHSQPKRENKVQGFGTLASAFNQILKK